MDDKAELAELEQAAAKHVAAEAKDAGVGDRT